MNVKIKVFSPQDSDETINSFISENSIDCTGPGRGFSFKDDPTILIYQERAEIAEKLKQSLKDEQVEGVRITLTNLMSELIQDEMSKRGYEIALKEYLKAGNKEKVDTCRKNIDELNGQIARKYRTYKSGYTLIKDIIAGTLDFTAGLDDEE